MFFGSGDNLSALLIEVSRVCLEMVGGQDLIHLIEHGYRQGEQDEFFGESILRLYMYLLSIIACGCFAFDEVVASFFHVAGILTG
jgi:hypothetical protein